MYCRYGTLSGNEFSDSSGIGSMASAASRAAAAQEMTAVRYKMECEQTLRYPVNAYQPSIGAIQSVFPDNFHYSRDWA
jgi:hypothetical protein